MLALPVVLSDLGDVVVLGAAMFLPTVGKIAERHSGLKLIVDHMGVPRASNGEAAYRFQPEFACIRTCTAVLIRIARPSG
jgi:hypothetical protein